jgi:hypothetical protein
MIFSDQEILKKMVEGLAKRHIAPRVLTIDRTGEYSYGAVHRMSEGKDRGMTFT